MFSDDSERHKTVIMLDLSRARRVGGKMATRGYGNKIIRHLCESRAHTGSYFNCKTAFLGSWEFITD